MPPLMLRAGSPPGTFVMCSWRRATMLVAALLVLPVIRPAPVAGASEVPAAVVVIGDLTPDGVVDAAHAQHPALWRLESLKGAARQAPPAPAVPLERLARAYLDADFLRCLAELQAPPLSFDRLLERGRRDDAARVGTFAAACALGARDETRARELLRRLLVRELDAPDVLSRTTPALQQLAEDERQKAQRWGRVSVAVVTHPDGASVKVDGAGSCTAAPCRLNLLRGEHLFVAEKMGSQPRVVQALLDDDQTVTLTLAPSSADEAKEQLAATLGTGADPSCVEMARTATTAFGVKLVVLAWQRAGQVHANAFQRSGDAVTHVALSAEPMAPARAVAAALADLGSARPDRPRWLQELFGPAGLAIASLTAVGIFILGRRTVRG